MVQQEKDKKYTGNILKKNLKRKMYLEKFLILYIYIKMTTRNLITIGAVGDNSAPYYPLLVNAKLVGGTYGTKTFFQAYSGFIYDSITFTSGDGVSIYSLGAVISESTFGVVSDQRVKNNIKPLLNSDSLDKIRKLTPSTFNFIDTVRKSPESNTGFIAQEVRNIIDNSVTIMKNYVPNIYDLGNVKQGNIITLINKTTDLFTLNESGNPIKINLHDKDNNQIETFIEKIIDDKSFQISDMLVENEIFVNGQEVEDFLTLNKDVIFTHLTAAVKELDSIVQNQQLVINNLELRLAKLESKI
jgi:hypothetical protein